MKKLLAALVASAAIDIYGIKITGLAALVLAVGLVPVAALLLLRAGGIAP
jgi:hypothetical protein